MRQLVVLLVGVTTVVGGSPLPASAQDVATPHHHFILRANPEEALQLREQGFDFYDWGPREIRLVTSWDQRTEEVESLAAAIAAL